MAKWKRKTQSSVSQAKEPCFSHLLIDVTASCRDDGEGERHMVREMAETASGVALWRLAVDRCAPIEEAVVAMVLAQALAQD
jgi:hypothetical protein